MNSKLVIWTNRDQKICFRSEIAFIRKCEKNCNISMIGQARFIILLGFLKQITSLPKEILDLGGNVSTARWLEAKFPGSKVTILNRSEKETKSWKSIIKKNAENFKTKKKFDLVFMGDILEHTYNPDGIIAGAVLALKPHGYLILSTPNLACIYNRLFLLLGWAPIGYYPSLRYMTGNPFFKEKSGNFGIIMDHKSVFTWKGLTELLSLYGLIIKKSAGYDINNEEKSFKVPSGNYELLGSKIRPLLSRILPDSLQVGMMFICQIKDNIDRKTISKGVLDGNIWD